MTSWLCRLVITGLAAVGLVVAGQAPIAAQADLKETAKQYVTDGLKAQATGRYDEAILFYSKAYDLVPHPELLFNLGQAHRLRGDKAIALAYYQKYLAVDARGRGAAEASKWAKQIDLELRVEAEELRQAEEQREAEANRKIREEHEAKEAREREVKEREAKEREANENEQPREVSSTVNTSRKVPPQATQSVPAEYEPRILTTKRIVALWLVGGALVSGSLAYYFHSRGEDWSSRYEEAMSRGLSPEMAESYVREADQSARWSDYLILSGVTLIGVGGVLWITGAADREPQVPTISRWTPVVSGEGAGMLFSGSF